MISNIIADGSNDEFLQSWVFFAAKNTFLKGKRLFEGRSSLLLAEVGAMVCQGCAVASIEGKWSNKPQNIKNNIIILF